MVTRARLRVVCLSAALVVSLGVGEACGESFDYHSIRRSTNLAFLDGRLEGEIHFDRHGNARVQEMRHYGPNWSGGAHFLWDGGIGDQARVRLPVVRTSRYRLQIQFTRAVDYGTFQVSLDGKPIGKEIDLFSTRVELAPLLDFGEFDLIKGSHTLTFKLSGANQRAKKFRGQAYLLGLDYVQVTDLDPPAKSEDTSVQQSTGETIDLAAAALLTKQYCADCHHGDQPKGDIDLAKLMQAETNLTDDIEQAEAIAEALSFGTMPPEDKPQPSAGQRKQLVRFFYRVVDQFADRSTALEPVVMRRMTRYEYNNAVRDLLRLRGDIYPLPERTLRIDSNHFNPASGLLPSVVLVGNRTLGKNQVEKQILDGVSPFAIDLQAEHGFNNRGDELSISPILLEAFIDLGESIVASSQFPDYCRDYPEIFVGSAPAQRSKDIQLARRRLQKLLTHAFREPADKATLQRYVDFFVRAYDQSGEFTDSMKQVVGAMLASPRFLFLSESKRSDLRIASLSDHELATRLSFFLWSTIPDEELLRLAGDGRLRDPAVLDQQVTRMLLDPRSRALSENFARQWLRLDQLITAVPDMERFPYYYSRIGCEQWKFGLQTMVEPLLLFESIIVEDRSIMLLIDSNYSYRSDELQSWYEDDVPFGGKPNVNRFGTHMQSFVRRDLNSRRQGGVITTAATMTMTSSPLRTSPITRGAWVATVILNQPPEPPPDVVPKIEADDDTIEAQGLTLRQRLKQHQSNESCAACHSKIDPWGFVLENYDAVGRWRQTYRSGLPIDAGGTLFGDADFADVESFKDRLLERPEVFMRAFTEHLLSYALGRELRTSDKPAIDRIVNRVRAGHGRFSTVVSEIVKSQPFRHKTNQQRLEK